MISDDISFQHYHIHLYITNTSSQQLSRLLLSLPHPLITDYSHTFSTIHQIFRCDSEVDVPLVYGDYFYIQGTMNGPSCSPPIPLIIYTVVHQLPCAMYDLW